MKRKIKKLLIRKKKNNNKKELKGKACDSQSFLCELKSHNSYLTTTYINNT